MKNTVNNKTMGKHQTIRIDRKEVITRDGMDVCAFIAGVNSGAYGLPFCIIVRAWHPFLWMRKFFWREAKLTEKEVRELHAELGRVIETIDATKRAATIQPDSQ